MIGSATGACGPVVIETFAVLAVLLFLKHLAADGPLQSKYQLKHKGTLGHPGGLLHAGIHTGLTALCLVGWLLWAPVGFQASDGLVIAAILLAEFSIHYFTDFTKIKLDRHFGWSKVEVAPDGTASLRISSHAYFIIFLADQTVHSLTYVWILYAVGTWMGGPAAMLSACQWAAA